jgi:large subunit ribosomal protein L25
MSTTLKADLREKVGTRHSRKLRAEGRIPASLQAEGKSPHVDIAIDEDDFLAARRHHEHVYSLEYGNESESALVRELHWDVFGERILHVEFRRVDLTKKTEVEVTLEVVGMPKTGIVNTLVTHVTVSALPTDIPDSIVVKVAGLEPGVHITARELPMPEGVDLVVDDPEQTLIQINEHRIVEEPETPVEGVEGVEGEEGAEAAEGGAAAAEEGKGEEKSEE